MIVIGTMLFSLTTGARMVSYHSPLIHAVKEAKVQAALGHLWFEEVLSGDEHEEITVVWEHFKRARWYAQVIIHGGRDSECSFMPVQDPVLMKTITGLLDQFDTFVAVAEKRYEKRQLSRAGSELDQLFDEEFKKLFRQLDEVSLEIHHILQRDSQRFRVVQVLLIILCFVLTLVLISALRRYQIKQKKSEKDLVEQQQLLETFFNAIDDALLIHPLKEEGGLPFIFVNNAAVKRYGYSKEELLHLSAKDISRHDDSTMFVKQSHPLRTEKTSHQIFEATHVTKAGKEIPVEVNSTVIEMEKNRPLILSVARDISERKEEEKRRQQLETQLQQSQKMESIGRLAGGIAHDFNNILSAINGYAELCLLTMAEDNKNRADVVAILNSGKRAARLTAQLLAFSRRQIIRPELINANREIENVCKMLERILGEDIEVKLCLQEDLWRIKMDRSQLEQVIINIAVNARDAMPSGGMFTIESENIVLGESYMKQHHGVDPGEYVMLAFSDTGIGMSEAVQKNIFEPFYTSKERDKGIGLGLATVYGTVKQNDGNITVYSELEKGTTFKIYFHRTLEEEGASPVKVEAEELDYSHCTETLMLVEDDDVIRKMCADYLVSQGYTVLTAVNGKDALKVLERYYGAIDLLLSDVVMPKMGGPELAEKLKVHYPALKVLYMSGYTENAIVRHGVLKKDVNFIQKPVTPQVLARRVRSLLG